MYHTQRTVGHKLVHVLSDLLCHHVWPPLLVCRAGQDGHEHILGNHSQCLQGVLSDLSMDDLQAAERCRLIKEPSSQHET